jgi:hypothetical protein
LDFYFIKWKGTCNFTFPQSGPGEGLSNGPITSVTLFTSETIPDSGATIILVTIALCGLSRVRAFGKRRDNLPFTLKRDLINPDHERDVVKNATLFLLFSGKIFSAPVLFQPAELSGRFELTSETKYLN